MFAGFPSMERRPDRSARDFGPGPSANDNALVASSALPLDARAIVEPVPTATNQRAQARRGGWRVRFQPRWGPSADPLTGWTGGGDPLDTIELRFPDRLSAEAYCRRRGLAFTSHGKSIPPIPSAPSPTSVPGICCWPTGPHQLCYGQYRLAS